MLARLRHHRVVRRDHEQGEVQSGRAREHVADESLMAEKIPDFDVLAEDPDSVSTVILEKLYKAGFKDARKVKHEPLGEIIPMHYEIHIGSELLAFIYEPIACHSYNSIKINGKMINVATIDTMLTFYLAFLVKFSSPSAVAFAP